MESKTMKTRISAIAIALVMLLSLIPIVVLAEDAYGLQGAGVKIQMLDPADITVDYVSESNDVYKNTINTLVQLTDGTATFQLKVNSVGNNIPRDTQANVDAYFKGKCDHFYVNDANGEKVSDVTFTCHGSDPIGGTTDISWYMDVSGLEESTSYTLVIPNKDDQSWYFGGKWSNWGIKSDIYFNFTTAGETEPEPTFGPNDSFKPSESELSDGEMALVFAKMAQENIVRTKAKQEQLDLDDVETAGLVTIGSEQYYYSRQKSLVDSSITQFLPYISSQSDDGMAINDNTEVFLYSAKEFTSENLVATIGSNPALQFGAGTISSDNVPELIKTKRAANVSFSVGMLEPSKTYYVVFGDGFHSNSGKYKIVKKYVCEFTTQGVEPAHTHTEETLAAKAATCTETGLTEGKKCSECGEILVAQETIPALGHDYVNGVCTRCGEEKPKMTAELTSSAGNDLKARTQTTLKVENMQNGNPEDYTYKFIVYNTSTNQWYKLQDFGPETEFDWYTGPAGVKNLYVDIKSKTDETDVTRIALEGVNVTDSDLAVKSFTISPEGVLPAQSQATLTVEAEKGTEPYEYKFIVYNSSTQQWYKLKDFGPESTFDWYTGPVGEKTLYVDVKDGTGKVVRESLSVSVQ